LVPDQSAEEPAHHADAVYWRCGRFDFARAARLSINIGAFAPDVSPCDQDSELV
jgi:hypothetical protein